MRARLAALAAACVLLANAEVRRHPRGQVIPHDKYVHVVSEADSPLERAYVPTGDGLYVAAAIRKPKGPGPFPAILYFHGAPGGRGMEKLVTWSRGDTGGPLWERFLREGYVVVVADYRRIPGQQILAPVTFGQGASYVEDGEAVLGHIRALPYVDPNRIAVYGVSLGGNLAAYLASRNPGKIAAAIFGAGAVNSFLGGGRPAPAAEFRVDADLARKNIEPIRCPVLLLVATGDSLSGVSEVFHDLLIKYGKTAQLDIYEGGYHDFVAGPQGHPGRDEPLLTSTLDALDVTLAFLEKTLSERGSR